MKLHNNNMNQWDIIDLVDQLFEIDRSKRSIIVGAVDGHNHVPQIRIRNVLKVTAGGCLRPGEYTKFAAVGFKARPANSLPRREILGALVLPTRDPRRLHA